MKKHLLLVALVFVAAFSCSAQTLYIPKPVPNPNLTATDRKLYVLSADIKRIRSYDSVVEVPSYSPHRENVHFLTVPITLTNNSSEILRYISMSCGWDEIYLTNNANVQIEGIPCDKNIPVILTISPHSSSKVWLTIADRQHHAKSIGFNVGMILRRSDANDHYPAHYTARKDKQDVIWSNTITIPGQ